MLSTPENTYKGFLNDLFNQDTLLSSVDSNYWFCVASFVCRVYEFYSVNPRATWLSHEIQKRYPEEKLEKLEHTDDIDKVSVDLQRIYQNIEALLSIGPIPENLRSTPEIELFLQHHKDHSFTSYLLELVKQAQEEINTIKNALNQRLAQLQTESTIALQEKLEGLLSSTNDLIKEHEENIKKLSEENRRLSDEISKKKADVEADVKDVEDLIKKTQNDANNILSTVLTVLGLFVAIILAFAGGFFSVSASLESKISNIPQVQLAHFMLMGHVITNLIFLFMFMLARLSNKNLCATCKNCTGHDDSNKCHSCGSQCNWYHRLTRKYPYIVVANWFFAIGYVVLLLWWYIDEFLYDAIYIHLLNNINWQIVCLVAILLLLAVVIIIPLLLQRKGKKDPLTVPPTDATADTAPTSEAE